MGLRLLAALALSQAATPESMPAGAVVVEQGEILDHRDQWGVSAALGTSLVSDSRPLSAAPGYSPGFLPTLEVGVSRALGDRDELQLRLRLLDDPLLRPWVIAGYRLHTSEGPWTTFFEIDGIWISGRDWGLGTRAGFGLVWDPVRWGGLFLQLGIAAAVGPTFDTAVDVALGTQIRW